MNAIQIIHAQAAARAQARHDGGGHPGPHPGPRPEPTWRYGRWWRAPQQVFIRLAQTFSPQQEHMSVVWGTTGGPFLDVVPVGQSQYAADLAYWDRVYSWDDFFYFGAQSFKARLDIVQALSASPAMRGRTLKMTAMPGFVGSWAIVKDGQVIGGQVNMLEG